MAVVEEEEEDVQDMAEGEGTPKVRELEQPHQHLKGTRLT